MNNMTTSQIVTSALIQAGVVYLIALIWWLVSARKKQSFWAWLGWHLPVTTRPGRLVLIALATWLGFGALSSLFMPLVSGGNSTSQFHGLGIAGLPAVLAWALLQTSLTEETLFRGLIGKRTAARFGFWAGNTVQATLFGLAHTGLYLLVFDVGLSVAVGIFTAALGLVIGYINEKLAGGSLVVSYAGHALSNLTVGLLGLASVL